MVHLDFINGSQSLCFNASSTECGFMGDGDTYGLGIRLGVYTQWISSLLAYFFLPDEAASAGGVNTCFTLSNYIGKNRIFLCLKMFRRMSYPSIHLHLHRSPLYNLWPRRHSPNLLRRMLDRPSILHRRSLLRSIPRRRQRIPPDPNRRFSF